MKQKAIPTTIFFASKPAVADTTLKGKSLEVSPTYASDAENLKRVESAKDWAGNSLSIYNPKSGKYERPKVAITGITENNSGFKLQILSLEIRGQGGRAYKVIDQKNRLFDLREDTLLEVLTNVGIEPDGILPGEYLWSLQGSEMKLIRFGSEIHKELLNNTENPEINKPVVPVMGKTYTNSKGDWYYLGKKDGMQHWIEFYSFDEGKTFGFYDIENLKSKTVYAFSGVVDYKGTKAAIFEQLIKRAIERKAEVVEYHRSYGYFSRDRTSEINSHDLHIASLQELKTYFVGIGD